MSAWPLRIGERVSHESGRGPAPISARRRAESPTEAGGEVRDALEADAVCDQLRTEYPEVHDWLMRKAMICEARGQTELAIEYCQRTIDWMDAHPDDFDPESREPFYADIERLRNATKSTP